MLIENSNIAMTASRIYAEKFEQSEELRAWVDESVPVGEGVPEINDRVTLSNDALESFKRYKDGSIKGISDEDGISVADPLYIMKLLIEEMSGFKLGVKEVEVAADGEDVAAIPTPETPAGPVEGPERAGYGIDYRFHESYTETERTSFSASGTVKTADGREISFDLELVMERTYHTEENFVFKAGDALIDPLVLNFSGSAADLTDVKFSFDLNADGKDDTISKVAGGSGLLVFDRNGDGVANDGSELFGPTTGNGFGELASLDADGNGWIDEADPAYGRLSIWKQDVEPGIFDAGYLKGLRAAGVGAIALGYKETLFSLTDADNAQNGRIARTGVFLTEDGKAATIQQLDIAV